MILKFYNSEKDSIATFIQRPKQTKKHKKNY